MSNHTQRDWSTPHDDWLIPILNRARHSGPIEFRALPSEAQLHIDQYTQRLVLEGKVAELLRLTPSGTIYESSSYTITGPELAERIAELQSQIDKLSGVNL